MEIKLDNVVVKFEEICPGDVFMWENILCMKIETVFGNASDRGNRFFNAVRLNDGRLFHFSKETVSIVRGHYTRTN